MGEGPLTVRASGLAGETVLASSGTGPAVKPPPEPLTLDRYISHLGDPGSLSNNSDQATGLALILGELVTGYAPRIYWSNEDPLLPMDPLQFIQDSSLWYYSQDGREQLAAKGEINPQELGNQQQGEYAYMVSLPGLYRRGTYSPSSQNPVTRLHEANGILGGEEGFYLKYEAAIPGLELGEHLETLKADRRLADTPIPPHTAPLLWRLNPEVSFSGDAKSEGHIFILLEYWYFSSYSYSNSLQIGNHQGDWEGAAVLVDLSIQEAFLVHHPVAVFTSQHEEGSWTCAKDLEWLFPEQHPVLYSSLGGHATFPKAGEFENGGSLQSLVVPNDRAEKGRGWDAFQSLRPLVLEPYYGTTLGWGDVNERLGMSTGPMAPSAVKTYPRPRDKYNEPFLRGLVRQCKD